MATSTTDAVPAPTATITASGTTASDAVARHLAAARRGPRRRRALVVGVLLLLLVALVLVRALLGDYRVSFVDAIAIIGAGISGLSCASQLQQAGINVTLFDKSRGPGGNHQ